MTYIIIAALIVWIFILYTVISGLKNEIGILKKELKKLNLKERHYITDNKETNYETKKTRPPLKTQTSQNTDISQEEIIKYQGNKIPRKFLYPKKDLEDTSHFFYGKKVVISGEFDEFPVRPELAEYLWNIGADVDTSVSQKTDFLFCGSGVGPSKLQAAKANGTTLLYEEDILNYLPNFKSKYL